MARCTLIPVTACWHLARLGVQEGMGSDWWIDWLIDWLTDWLIDWLIQHLYMVWWIEHLYSAHIRYIRRSWRFADVLACSHVSHPDMKLVSAAIGKSNTFSFFEHILQCIKCIDLGVRLGILFFVCSWIYSLVFAFWEETLAGKKDCLAQGINFLYFAAMLRSQIVLGGSQMKDYVYLANVSLW
jgi:hypothetical protein